MKNSIDPEMVNLIKKIQSDRLFKNHFLAGGTALTIQIGHRTSTDIDLFTAEYQNSNIFTEYFEKKFKNIKIAIVTDEFIRVFVDSIKIEMVHDNYKIIESPKIVDNIRVFSINEIAAMKLRAIIHRTEARDFIDMAYLLQKISIKDIFALYKKKYGTISELFIKRTLLTKSKTIKDDEWLMGIKMLKNDMDIKGIPELLEREIKKYNDNVGIGYEHKDPTQ